LVLLRRHVQRVKAVQTDGALELVDLLPRIGLTILAHHPRGVRAVRLDYRDDRLSHQVAAHDEMRAPVVLGRVQKLPPEDVAAMDIRGVVDPEPLGVAPSPENAHQRPSDPDLRTANATNLDTARLH